MSSGNQTDLLDRLAEHPLAVTTVASDDVHFGSRLQNALVRGEDELFSWGIGAGLQPGATVALYVPWNESMRAEDRQQIRHLYSVAARASEEASAQFEWKYLVFLYRRVSLTCSLSLAELEADRYLGGYARQNFRNAGRAWIPSPKKREVVRAFWQLVLRNNPQLGERIDSRLLPGQEDDAERPRNDVAISYASEDMGFAQRLNDGLLARQRSLFYSTSGWELDELDEAPMAKLLGQVFGTARVCVPLLSRHFIRKRWPTLELLTMLDRPEQVVAASLDGTLPGQVDPRLLAAESSAGVAGLLKEAPARLREVEVVRYERLEDVENLIDRILGKSE